ncbi:putative transcription factor C2H2 family [Dioscorea sansibarensis]
MFSNPDAEVVALSPKTLLATNRYICEVCHKGFQRDQNLQLHRRGHNLPWKLKQRTNTEVKKKVYVCPELSCVHHDPSRALGDLTGIKKHYSRKHGEKKWKCDKCSKKYAVQSDWKAHVKICGTKEYRCDCGTIFSRKDSFVTHRAFCDVLAEENCRTNHGIASMVGSIQSQTQEMFSQSMAGLHSSSSSEQSTLSLNPLMSSGLLQLGGMNLGNSSAYTSATALLQKAAEMGARVSDDSISPILLRGFTGYNNIINNNNINSDSTYSGLTQFVENHESCMVGLQGQVKGNNGEEVEERRDGRMTQDFLGIGSRTIAGSVSHGYVQDSAGLRYPDEQQQQQQQQHDEEEMYSYHHQMAQRTNALEKPMWDF